MVVTTFIKKNSIIIIIKETIQLSSLNLMRKNVCYLILIFSCIFFDIVQHIWLIFLLFLNLSYLLSGNINSNISVSSLIIFFCFVISTKSPNRISLIKQNRVKYFQSSIKLVFKELQLLFSESVSKCIDLLRNFLSSGSWSKYF